MNDLEALSAAKLLALSGMLAILWSTLLGFVMLIPHQAPPGDTKQPLILWRWIGAAHLGWIMLGLVSLAAAFLIQLFSAAVPWFIVAGLIFGAWINPTVYVFRAFGIDAFRFGGRRSQKLASVVGGVSSLAILLSLGALIVILARL